ncbi:hypothetical protein PSENEW3_00001264 [Picochlorum sp. SENEW3]|nr:hypothetical protein PSENEW3_00001264 [Picochlorum sp. SENEW3]
MSDISESIQQSPEASEKKARSVSLAVYLITVGGIVVIALGLGLGLGLGLKDNDKDASFDENAESLAFMTSDATLPARLWSGNAGVFGGYSPADIPGGLSTETMLSLYGKDALERATRWAKEGKALWCSTAADPDADPPLAGVFPFVSPPTQSTNWPGACPNSNEAQALFNKGLGWRMLFNDNEATCAFQAASRVDPTCSMAFLGAALAMGPNVNYAFITSDRVYRLILESLNGGLAALNSGTKQSALAEAVYAALSQRYCVPTKEALDEALALPVRDSFERYNNQSASCNVEYANTVSALAEEIPQDPNIAALAAGALMQLPAWQWWSIGSTYAGDLVNVSSAAGENNLTSIGLASGLVERNASIANAILQRGLQVQPKHLGILHYMIHNLEASPQPTWALSVATDLYDEGGSTQGHAAHMKTHMDMRVGDYEQAILGNWVAQNDDAWWNLNRTGGGIMSVLYKYVPHNTAFIAEAAQHGANWKNLAASLTFLGYAAGNPMLADESMQSLGQYLTRQFLQPLRFGMYEQVLAGSDLVEGVGVNASIKITLPDGTTGKSPCDDCWSGLTLAKSIALSRLGRPQEANNQLAQLIQYSSPYGCGNDIVSKAVPDACNPENIAASPVNSAIEISRYWNSTIVASRKTTNDLNSSSASGTLTINNLNPIAMIYMLLPSAELKGAEGDIDEEIVLLRYALEAQSQLQYDEPSPFFYQIQETLAGALMQRGEPQDLEEAINALRSELFAWPRSSLATLGLAQALQLSNTTAENSAGIEIMLQEALTMNDTVLDTSWL